MKEVVMTEFEVQEAIVAGFIREAAAHLFFMNTALLNDRQTIDLLAETEVVGFTLLTASLVQWAVEQDSLSPEQIGRLLYWYSSSTPWIAYGWNPPRSLLSLFPYEVSVARNPTSGAIYTAVFLKEEQVFF